MQERKFKISSDAICQEIAGEAVILDLATSTYFGLDALGLRIWQLLSDGLSQLAVEKMLFEEYEISAEILSRDIEAFLARLESAGLVHAE
jgi:hypothetical protein